eukprot:TRINITY_DN1840_c0_g1_i3.p1 TRINITY_DN1840_c0_g1~~TRINITY_DN1840_c0_g1_i3.p1  ORF type:complete len:532 (+),score=88.03 TRINITY_DN1840_c0_g1_i3:628-2223(+)
MVAYRPLREEFEKLTESSPGMEEFAYHSMLPFFKRLENNENNNPAVFWDRSGRGGRVPLSNAKTLSVLDDRVLVAASENDINPTDVNTLQIGGISKIQATVTSNGRRASSAVNYLDSTARSNPKFTLKNGCKVRRILFNANGTIAIGVEYQQGNDIFNVTATKEIIISAGNFETPRILKSSGIGPSDELQALGIAVVQNLAKVGSNFHDKPNVLANYRLRVSDNPRMNTTIVFSNSTFQEWKINGTGMLASIFNIWGIHGGPADIDAEFVDGAPLPDSTYNFTNWVRVICWNGSPKSRGSIVLNPANIYGIGIIDAAFLRDPVDVDKLVECHYKSRKILQDSGIITEDLTPSTSVWNNETDFRQYIYNTASPTQHSCGTCRIGTNSSVAVVNNKFKVFGISNLRIVDYSIVPTVFRVNPSIVLYALSEQLSDYIREAYQDNPPVGSITLRFNCTPPMTVLNDYSIWSVKNTHSKGYVYHWESTNGAKGAFTVEANSESIFYTPIDKAQTVTLKINGNTIASVPATNTICPY